jgi:hypothetical protein
VKDMAEQAKAVLQEMNWVGLCRAGAAFFLKSFKPNSPKIARYQTVIIYHPLQKAVPTC